MMFVSKISYNLGFHFS